MRALDTRDPSPEGILEGTAAAGGEKSSIPQSGMAKSPVNIIQLEAERTAVLECHLSRTDLAVTQNQGWELLQMTGG